MKIIKMTTTFRPASFIFFTLNFAIKLMVTSIGLFLIIPIENLSRQAVAEHDYLARPRLPLKSVI